MCGEREREREQGVQKTNSFFRVLNLMSPKARDTEMSPHIRPSRIYKSDVQVVKTRLAAGVTPECSRLQALNRESLAYDTKQSMQRTPSHFIICKAT